MAEHAADDRPDDRAGNVHVAPIFDDLATLDPAVLLGRSDDRAHGCDRDRIQALARWLGIRVSRSRLGDSIRAALVVRNVNVVVPRVLDEVDRLTASIVLAAMLAPVSRMAGRHPQVDRLSDDAGRQRLDHDRLRVDEARRWQRADVDAPVEPRLTDADGNASEGRGAKSQRRDHAQETLHRELLARQSLHQRAILRIR